MKLMNVLPFWRSGRAGARARRRQQRRRLRAPHRHPGRRADRLPSGDRAAQSLAGRARPGAATGWAWTAAGLALAASLLLPWFSGTSDGDPLTIAGWDTEPGFTIGMLACALVIAVVRRPLAVALAAAVAIGLTIWMLQRGDRYSGHDLGPGGFVALAIALAVLGTAIRRLRA